MADVTTRDGLPSTAGLATAGAGADACSEVRAVGNRSVTNKIVPSGAASSSAHRKQRGRPTTDPGPPSSSSLRPPFCTLSNNREREADVLSAPKVVKMTTNASPGTSTSPDCAPARDKVIDRSPNPFVKKTKKKKKVSSKVTLMEDDRAGLSNGGGGSGDPATSITSMPNNKGSAVTPTSRSGTGDSLRGCGEGSMIENEGDDENEDEEGSECGDGDRMDLSEERALEDEYRALRARMEEIACSEFSSRMVAAESESESDPGGGALSALHRQLRDATASIAEAGQHRGEDGINPNRSVNNTQKGRGTGIGTREGVHHAVEVKAKVVPLADVIASMSPKAILSLFQELDELEDDEEEEEEEEGEEDVWVCEDDEDDEEEEEEEEGEELYSTGARVSDGIEWADQEYIGIDIDGSVSAEAVTV